MGKAKRTKNVPTLGSENEDALAMAGEMICAPEVVETFLAYTVLGGLKMDPVTWAGGMRGAFKHAGFRGFLEECVKVAHRDFWAGDPNKALQFGGNRLPPGTPIADACARAHRRLTSSPEDPRWFALVMFCLGRMISATTKGQYNSDEWTEFTLFMMKLEGDFVNARGTAFAQAIVGANKDYFEGQLEELIGTRMLHGLAEAAINAKGARFFS